MSGLPDTCPEPLHTHMAGFPSPFGRDDGDLFDDYDEFVPANVPDPGPSLAGHDVLEGREHAAFHRLTRELFEERKVYDMTFNYNLARLNLDTRHSGAGYRYAAEVTDAADVGDAAANPDADDGGNAEATPDAEEAPDPPAVADDARVLRAEFRPTTPFCPQTHTLTIGSFRAWNSLSDRHEYDLVRVRAAPMHHRSEAINEQLAELEAEYLETGEVGDGEGADGTDGEGAAGGGNDLGSNPMERAMREEGSSRGSQAPF